MPKGKALTIGLNAVSPASYGGWSGVLAACEADARDMSAIAKSRNFEVTNLMTKDATRANVIAAITSAAQSLKDGDIFLLSYSGHGGTLPDLNSDEEDFTDETWCLFDGEIVDDELYSLYSKFAKGVRILVFSDSCHSGTVAKEAFYQNVPSPTEEPVTYRNMPADRARLVYDENKAFYDKILKDRALKISDKAINPSVLLISGCQDNQLSADGKFNGLFTAHLRRAWRDGQFKGNYKEFHKAILKGMPPTQTPNYFRAGAANPAFDLQNPFSV